VPSWKRDRLPLIYCGDELAWAPGLGIDARYRAGAREAGWMPEWKSSDSA
jgi:tRNA(Ile)-lysidine synthase